MERQEAKIQLLEMKLKDKRKVEIELEACKEVIFYLVIKTILTGSILSILLRTQWNNS